MSFADLKGQPRVVQVLKRTIESGRLAHAYLFVGPDGVGRRTAAKQLAMTLNCERGGSDACGECAQCRKLQNGFQLFMSGAKEKESARTTAASEPDALRNGHHPDVLLVEPEKDFITIDRIRKLQTIMYGRPYEGRYRLVVLAPADTMNAASQNALLKTLEEPGPGNVLILITATPHRMLRTIESRCQRVVFGLIPRNIIIDSLVQHGVEPERADLLSRLCEGSLGRALSLAEGDLSQVRQRIIDGLQALISKGSHGIWKFADELAEGNMEEFGESLEMVKTWMRDALLLHSGAGSDKVINSDGLDLLLQISKRFDESALMKAIDDVSDLQAKLRYYPNRQLALWNLGLSLTGSGLSTGKV